MAIVGLDSLIYGVDDMAAADRFWTDFGLKRVKRTAKRLVFETAERTTIEVCPADDPSLPAALAKGNTVREVIWGVTAKKDLDAIAARLGTNCAVRRDRDGTLHATDHLGYAIAFRKSRAKAVRCKPAPYNAPGNPARVNTRGKIYERARPQQLSHVVLLAPDLEGQKDFYVKRLGFKISDWYPGRGYFTRAPGSHDHHNLFLLKAGDAVGFHHVAFEVRDIHEVFGGGLYMTDRGWKTHLGPGRHPISSCYFWYFSNPCGGAAEYDSDSDYVTDKWKPRAWESTPEAFAEWAYPDGAARYSGIQTGKA